MNIIKYNVILLLLSFGRSAPTALKNSFIGSRRSRVGYSGICFFIDIKRAAFYHKTGQMPNFTAQNRAIGGLQINCHLV
jgi:hypothetical protein